MAYVQDDFKFKVRIRCIFGMYNMDINIVYTHLKEITSKTLSGNSYSVYLLEIIIMIMKNYIMLKQENLGILGKKTKKN